jgi:hypothetical protein
VIEIQAASLWADQEQPGAVVTVTAPTPPAALTVCELGVTAIVQPPPWVTVTF